MESDDEIEQLEVKLVLEAIHARYGYDLRDYTTGAMRRRVLALLAKTGLAHLGELQHRLLRDSALFASLFDDLTLQVTEMFRDPGFFRAFRAEVVPLLRTYPQLKIWHAGCSSGEEVYATAILLSEEGLYDRTQIYATDLSLQALERAREGVYPAGVARKFAANYLDAGGTGALESYVSAAYDRIAIKEALRKNVVFFQHDLVSDQPFGEMQVIFCRNVLIYFGAELRWRVIAKFSQSLCRGGFLCLGMSEQVPGPGDRSDFSPYAARERIYRHEGHS
jgi:chemotaxis protein methyltransferase CheR